MSKKTLENLKAAFAGESQARNKYDFFAEIAKQEGHEDIAEEFADAAANEQVHAKIIFNLLKGMGSTKDNLQAAIDGEMYEVREMYPEFARVAREEGEEEAADYFERVIKAEEIHAKIFSLLLQELESGEMAARGEIATWKCKVCGYVHEGTEPPLVCPLCRHQNSFIRIDR